MPPDTPGRPSSLLQVPGSVYKAHMGESLWKVPYKAMSHRIILLGEEPYIVAHIQDTLKHLSGFQTFDPAVPGCRRAIAYKQESLPLFLSVHPAPHLPDTGPQKPLLISFS